MSNNKEDSRFCYICELCGSLIPINKILKLKFHYQDNNEIPLIKMCEKCRCGFDLDSCLTIEDAEGVILNQYFLDLVG